MKLTITVESHNMELLNFATATQIFGRTPEEVIAYILAHGLHQMIESEFFIKAIETHRLLEAYKISKIK